MNPFLLKFCIITAFVLAAAIRSNCQTSLPEVFEQGTISEQLQYLEERTRIYENYRAIREDMFQRLSRNTLDTLTNAKSTINGLVLHTNILNNRIDSLTRSLDSANNELRLMTRTKNSIRLLGMEVNKITYNSIMWTILAILVFLLVSGYLMFRQNRVVTIRTKKDLDILKEEFEEYRKKSRQEREKMNMDHFNEIRKLKGLK
ncbi:MAG: hypothetical protein JXB19_01190 [Bacteroidales bacterium]|nr:hypothetical protein [Bacteroidales bacterium]